MRCCAPMCMGCFRHEAPDCAMLQSGGGAIVNNASIVAHIGFPGMAHYNASKHAVLGLTKTAGLEYFKAGCGSMPYAQGPLRPHVIGGLWQCR